MNDIVPTYAIPDEVVLFIQEHPVVGVATRDDDRPYVINFLTDRSLQPVRFLLHVPADLPPDDLPAWLAERLPKPAPAAVPHRTVAEWKDALLAALREQQKRSQERVNAARTIGQSPDPFDRDVAGWLANGLVDLLGDKVTGESFLKPGGAFQRLVEQGADTHFTENDFQRPNDIRFMDASRPAQSMLTKLSLASTNQYRAAAARLMNFIVQVLSASVDARPTTVDMTLLLENPAHRDQLPLGVVFSRIVAVGDEGQFAGWPAICRFSPPILEEIFPAVPEVILAELETPLAGDTPPEIVSPIPEPEPVAAEPPFVEAPLPSAAEVAYRAELARQDLFLETGILRERVDGDIHEFSQGELLRQRLERTWGQWFASRLAEFNPDELLLIEEFTQFGPAIETVRHAWGEGEDPPLPLPETIADVRRAEAVFDRFKKMRNLERLMADWEGPLLWSFDRAVEEGTATLDMLESDLLELLHEKGRDLSKYRIVRMDDLPLSPRHNEFKESSTEE